MTKILLDKANRRDMQSQITNQKDKIKKENNVNRYENREERHYRKTTEKKTDGEENNTDENPHNNKVDIDNMQKEKNHQLNIQIKHKSVTNNNDNKAQIETENKEFNWHVDGEWMKLKTVPSLIEKGAWALGAIIMNSEGQNIAITSCHLKGEKDPLATEVMAMKVGMNLVIQSVIKHILTESAYIKQMKMMNNGMNDLSRTKPGMTCKRKMKMKTHFVEIGFKRNPKRNNETSFVVARVCVTRRYKLHYSGYLKCPQKGMILVGV